MTLRNDRGPGRVLASTAGQFAGRLIHLAVNIISTLSIIRHLQPDDYGRYTLALTTTMLIGLVADSGLSRLAIREVTQGRMDQAAAAGSMLAVRSVLAAVSWALTQIVLLGLHAPASVHIGAGLLGAVFSIEALFASFSLPFHLNQRQELDTGLRLLGELGETALLFCLLTINADVAMLFLAPVTGAVIAAASAGWISTRRFGLGFRLRRVDLAVMLRGACTLVPGVLIGVTAIRLGGFVVARQTTANDTGLYNAALQPVEYAFLSSAVIIHVAFPRLSAAWETDHPAFTNIHRRTVGVLLGATLLAPVMAATAAAPLVRSVYGESYRGAASSLVVLSVTLPLMTVSAWNAFVLLAGGQQLLTLLYDLAALLLALVLHPVMVSRHGFYGAAIATLCVVTSVTIASTASVRWRLGATPDAAHLFVVLAALLSAAGGMTIADRWGIGAGLTASVIGYGFAAYVLAHSRFDGISIAGWAASLAPPQQIRADALVADPLVVDLVVIGQNARIAPGPVVEVAV